MSTDDRLDGLFLNAAQQSQGIEPLLENLFSFLRRKSDFFSGATQQKLEETVLSALRKQASLHEKDVAVKKREREKEEKLKQERAEKKKLQDALSAAASAPPAAPKSGGATVATPPKQEEDDDIIEMGADGTFDLTASAKTKVAKTTSESASAPASASSNSNSNSNSGKDKDADADDKEDEKEDASPAPIGNGGKTDKYVWTQTLSEVEASFTLPPGVKAKNLDVVIKNTKLRVALKCAPNTIYCDGELHKRILVDDTTWVVRDNELVISITKDNKMEWWKCLMVGDAEINTQKITPENSKLSDLDGDTRQTVEKMMFDQRQKAMGLPSSEEMQKQEMLKKFMSAHPEMDFSQAKFN